MHRDKLACAQTYEDRLHQVRSIVWSLLFTIHTNDLPLTISYLQEPTESRGVGRAVSGAAVLSKGDMGSPKGGVSYSPGVTVRYIASLHSRPSVHGEEPYPTRGDPVFKQNTADLKD